MVPEVPAPPQLMAPIPSTSRSEFLRQCRLTMYLDIMVLDSGLKMFSVKGQRVNTGGFAGH